VERQPFVSGLLGSLADPGLTLRCSIASSLHFIAITPTPGFAFFSGDETKCAFLKLIFHVNFHASRR
jgi:hypothetical protein